MGAIVLVPLSQRQLGIEPSKCDPCTLPKKVNSRLTPSWVTSVGVMPITPIA